MTTHTLTIDGATLRCAACPWRAVLTREGTIQQVTPGDRGQDHIGEARAQLAAQDAVAARLVARIQGLAIDEALRQRLIVAARGEFR